VTSFLWTIFSIAFVGIRNRGTIALQKIIGQEWRGPFAVTANLGVAVLAFVVMALIGNASAALLGPLTQNSKTFQSMVARSPGEALSFLVLALSAGFVEEFVFRGYIQRQCNALFGNAILASLVQVAIFTSGHFYQGWIRLVPVMLIGMVLTATATWRKSLMPGMVAHGLGDGLVSFFYFFKHL
jgi:membrane protease YdiL (CAAX protease family)